MDKETQVIFSLEFSKSLALKQEIRNLKTSIEIAQTEGEDGGNSTSNLDVLKRLSQLEKIVYGKDK